MKEIKKEFRWFFITEYEKEAEYLRQRHKEGWKFKNVIFPGIYTFEKCEPQDVIYQLDYNPDGVRNQSEYVQMFEDCGWEYLKEFMGYTYFILQVILNILWTPSFFILNNPALALIDIIALDIFVLLNIIEFYKISKFSGLLLIPYLLWLLFATYLNAGILILNLN